MPDQHATHYSYGPEKHDRKTQTAPRLKNLCQEFPDISSKQSPGVNVKKVAVGQARAVAQFRGMMLFVLASQPALLLTLPRFAMEEPLFGHEHPLSAHRGAHQFLTRLISFSIPLSDQVCHAWEKNKRCRDLWFCRENPLDRLPESGYNARERRTHF